MCTKHFIDSYCTSCDELVQGRSTERPCRPKYGGEHLGHCAGGIETKTVTEAVVCKNCERKQREKKKKKKKKKKDKDKGKEKEKEQKCGCGSAAVELASVNEEEQPLTES